MKKKTLILVLLVSLVLLNTSFACALQQADVNSGSASIAYGVQTINNDLIAVNLQGEAGLSNNLGLETIVTYYKNQNKPADSNLVLDFNSKLNIVHQPELQVSALLGLHTRTDKDSIYPRVGMLVSKEESADLDLNVGLDFLLKKDNHYLGYMLGFDYRLTNNIYLEIEHRRFSGQARTEGLNVGMRYYF